MLLVLVGGGGAELGWRGPRPRGAAQPSTRDQAPPYNIATAT